MQTLKSTNYDQLYTTNSPSLSKNSQLGSVKAQPNSYHIGQVLKGEILDLQQQEIKILLSNGQLLKGSLAASISLAISDVADFIVTDNQSTKLVLKLLSNTSTSTPNATIDKALEGANLNKTERNVNVVNELLKQQMSIDKNTIQTILRQTSMFKNASIETIVLMNKHQIPLSDTNTTQFEAYRDFEHSLFTQFRSLTSSLLANISSSTPDEANQLHQALLKLALPENEKKEISQQPINLKEVTLPKEASPILKTLTTLLEPGQLLKLEQSLLAQTDFQTSNIGQEQMKENSTFIDLLPSQKEEKLLQTETLGAQEKPLLQPEALQALERFFSQPSAQLLASSQYHSILENFILKTFTLSTKQLLESNGISRFYEQAEEKLNDLKQFFTQLEANTTENNYQATTTTIDKLTDNIDFMKVMNQFFGYVQLPMKLPHQYTNSELFVYTNKKQLQDGNKNISVMLHLDMEHLGPIDFHLSLFQQQVTAKINLVNEDSLLLLTQNLPQLQQALEAKGYTFNYELQQIEEEINIVKSYYEDNSSDLVMKRFTFDKRA